MQAGCRTRTQDAGGRTQDAGGESTERLWTLREEAARWCLHPVSDADGWGLNSMNNSRSGSVNNFYSLCEEKCGRAKLKYCFSDNYVGEFFHALQRHIKQTGDNLSVLSGGTRGAFPEVDHLPPSGRTPDGHYGMGGRRMSIRRRRLSAAALLSKPAWLTWAASCPASVPWFLTGPQREADQSAVLGSTGENIRCLLWQLINQRWRTS